MTSRELIPHLFRTEFRKITSVLCRHFGMGYLESAENVASDTFLAALETWPYHGIPANPTAWLYAVAKNKARNQLIRDKIAREKVFPHIQGAEATTDSVDIDVSEQVISDSQLAMIFAVCHPSIPVEGQVGLALRILCGFGIDEIANAFLSNRETIIKRLQRAREKLREEHVDLVMPGNASLVQRMEPVLTTLYLLFNEGYYSESNDAVLREDLCQEAMRLTLLLLENPATNQPQANALFALMCFHASRFRARRGNSGELILYDDQDESTWDQDLIARGVWYLHEASQGRSVSKFHLEAAIAWWYTCKPDTAEKWENILSLYNHLLQLQYSPVVALNRTMAVSKVHGARMAIEEAEKLQMKGSRFYFALLGFLYQQIDVDRARQNFELALSMTSNEHERTVLCGYLTKLG